MSVFLSRQGLAFRGDGDGSDSNFMQLLQMRAEDDQLLMKWKGKKTNKYTSPEIQNELIETMANKVLRNIITHIQKSSFYTIMADETADASNTEQLVICLRWVDNDFIVSEEFLGLYELKNLEAVTIFSSIQDVLRRLNLPFDKCRGQCYDMAAAMAGTKSGVATQISSIEPRALYTHCYGHALNLACSDAKQCCKIIKEALENAHEITKLIKGSPRREAIFKSLKDSSLECSTSPGIRVLCPTRWTVRADALCSIVENFTILLDVWDESMDYVKDTEMKSRIRGIASYMMNFNFLYGALLGECLLRHSDNLSRALQSDTISAAKGQSIAAMTVKTLESIRNDEACSLFWQKVTSKGKELKVNEPTLPRVRRIPKRLDEGGDPHSAKTAEDHYRQMYFEALDLLINCIQKRFNQNGYQTYMNLENLLLKVTSGESYEAELSFICNFYCSDINSHDLATQLITLRTNFPKDLLPKPSLKSIQDFILKNGPSLYSEIAVILKLILVMPATNAVSERSFSAMKRVKTYLRSTMTQKRMNNLMILHVHKDRTDFIKLYEVANEFVRGNERRLFTFGKFEDECQV